jgi:ribosomal subunit interface protein
MQVVVSFKHIATKPVLKDYLLDRLSDLVGTFVTKPDRIDATVSRKNGVFKVFANLIGGDGFKIETQAQHRDLHVAVDSMLQKLKTRLKKKKERIKEHKGLSHLRLIRELEAQFGQEPPIDAEDVIRYEKNRWSKSA